MVEQITDNGVKSGSEGVSVLDDISRLSVDVWNDIGTSASSLVQGISESARNMLSGFDLTGANEAPSPARALALAKSQDEGAADRAVAEIRQQLTGRPDVQSPQEAQSLRPRAGLAIAFAKSKDEAAASRAVEDLRQQMTGTPKRLPK